MILTIHGASFGGQDVTTFVQGEVTAQGTFTTTSSSSPPNIPDPWSGTRKSLCILYQYDDGPLQLLLAAEHTGVYTFQPGGFLQRQYLYPTPVPVYGDVYLIAILWGIMEYHPDPVTPAVYANGSINASNSAFGFDGWTGTQKSATVFYRHGLDGPIQVASGREGTVFTLP